MSEGSHRESEPRKSNSRLRKLTERARLFNLEERKKERTAAVKNIYKLLQSIDKIIEENESREKAADKVIELQDSVDKFRLIHERYLQLMTSEESSKFEEELMFRVKHDLSSHRKRYTVGITNMMK